MTALPLTPREAYWRESLLGALEGADWTPTFPVLDDMARSLAVSAENEGLGTGRDCIPNPLESEVRELTRKRADDQRRAEREEDALKDAYQSRLRDKDRVIQDLRDLLSGHGRGP